MKMVLEINAKCKSYKNCQKSGIDTRSDKRLLIPVQTLKKKKKELTQNNKDVGQVFRELRFKNE